MIGHNIRELLISVTAKAHKLLFADRTVPDRTQRLLQADKDCSSKNTEDFAGR